MAKKKKFDVIQDNKDWAKKHNLALDSLLEEISVMACEDMISSFKKGDRMHTLNTALIGWYAVCDTDGINAYFSTEKQAFAHRLDLINSILNK